MDLLLSREFLLYGGGVLFLLWAFFVVWFRKVTVEYIEEQAINDGILPPWWFESLDSRVIVYAMVLVRGKARHPAFTDDDLILKYSRKKDWYLAISYQLSFIAALTLWGLYYFLYGPTE
jgi:hypothetical protein